MVEQNSRENYMSTSEEISKERVAPTEVLIKSAFTELMKGVHTMLPGVIESFDPSTQRAKVTYLRPLKCATGQ